MATRWNIYNKPATDWGISAPTLRGTWTGNFTAPQTLMMGPDKADLGGIITGPTWFLPTGVGNKYWGFKLVGPRLAAQTIAGTLQYVNHVNQLSTLDADPHHALHVYVMAPDGSVRGTLLANYADTHPSDEWTNTATARGTQIPTLSSVDCQDNDRIVAEIGVQRNGGATQRTMGSNYGGTGADAVLGATTTGVPWLEFSDTLTLMPADARVTQVPVEALIKPDLSDVDLRMTQLPVEVMIGPDYGIARVSQLAVEVLIGAEDTPPPPAAIGRSHIVIAG